MPSTSRRRLRAVLRRCQRTAVDLAADHHPDDPLDVELVDRRSPTSVPSRSTVTRSQIRITSSSRWVMNTTAIPRLQPADDREQRCTSLSVSAEVGSSMTTSGVHRQALAISTICCSATERSRTSRADRRRARPRPVSAQVRRCSSPQPTAPANRHPADEDVLVHREGRHQVEFLIDRDDAELLRGMRVGQMQLGAVEDDGASVGLLGAGQDLEQRALAGAVLPSSACTSPRPT